ncbi:AAA family ATPase [Saccharothrix texasensis]
MIRNRRMAAHSNDTKTRDTVSRVAGIYGGNASGKSNLLNALHFMSQAVHDSHSRWKPEGGTPYDPFALDQESKSKASRFEAEFLIQDVRYQYGFEIDGKTVRSEWLYAFPASRRQTWFERDTSEQDPWYFGKNLKGRNKVVADVTRQNSLFLSTAAALDHDALMPVYNWFSFQLRIINQDNFSDRFRFTIAEIENQEESVNAITRLLKFADLGIRDLKVLRNHIDNEQRELTIKVAESLAAIRDPDKKQPTVEEWEEIFEEVTATVELKHSYGDAEPVGLPLKQESVGTRALLAMSGPIFHSLRTGATLLVDEIDTSLHPYLVAEIVNLFKSQEHNPHHAQLIFTSHDTSLLGNMLSDDPTLARDQIWLVQKNKVGASDVYPLTDFTPRRLENLERGYLQGRYGAIPFINQSQLKDLLSPTQGGSDGES